MRKTLFATFMAFVVLATPSLAADNSPTAAHERLQRAGCWDDWERPTDVHVILPQRRPSELHARQIQAVRQLLHRAR
jgi:hypothetical protein